MIKCNSDSYHKQQHGWDTAWRGEFCDCYVTAVNFLMCGQIQTHFVNDYVKYWYFIAKSHEFLACL